MSPFTPERELSNSVHDAPELMDETLQEEAMGHNRHSWSSSDASGSSSIATFFEIVSPPCHLASSHPKTNKRVKSNVVVVIEDSYSTAFEFENLHHFNDYSDELLALSTSSRGLQSGAEDLDDGIDRLDGILLPDFFTYTSEERELIRRNLPILRTQLKETEESSSYDRPASTISRDSLTYHLPTKPSDYHHHAARNQLTSSASVSDIFGDSTC